jgi:transposase-like protein
MFTAMATKEPASKPLTLPEATRYFSDPDVALPAAIELRWSGDPVSCPTCGSTAVHFIATRRIWRCANQHPRRQFSVKIGTVMEDSPIPLERWMVAIWLLANAKHGISSYALHRAIGVTQKTAWFLLHRIRLAMQSEDRGTLSGTVEVEDPYIGGKARTMHEGKRKRVPGGRSLRDGKVAVTGLLERRGGGESKVRPVVLSALKSRGVPDLVRQHPHERFTHLGRKVLTVPKSELDKREAK